MDQEIFTKEADDLFQNLPRPLRSYLETFFGNLAKALPKDCSVIMIGSCSRNELTWDYKGGLLNLIGDIEFIVYANLYKKSKIIDIVRKTVEAQCSRSHDGIIPIDLDFGVINKKSKRYFVKSIWLFEAQMASVLVFGTINPFSTMKKVNSNNIDLSSVNYLILVRLWNTYSELCKIHISANDPQYELKHVYLRHILDVLTVYLPWEKVLVCGYKERLKAFEELDRQRNLFLKNKKIFKTATKWKLSGRTQISFALLKDQFLELYDLLNKKRPLRSKPSLAFFIRGKIMNYYLHRIYFRRNLLFAGAMAIGTAHETIEKHIITILLGIHRSLVLNRWVGQEDLEFIKACDYFDINLNAYSHVDNLEKIVFIDLKKSLEPVMSPWFYGRSPNRK